MSWRSLLITQPAYLHVEQAALLVEQEEAVRVPLEDIAVVVLDHPQITLTHPLLAACAEQGIALYSTGPDHHPNGVHLPFLQHTRTVRMWRLQQAASRPRIKQLWAQIIRQKITNQALALHLSGASGGQGLEVMVQRVRSGDPDNLESQAALYYFPRLFGRQFHRKQHSWANSALNYGYAILRGAIARAVVAHGLHPSLGLFHDSERNAFNLVDDLIEPFRPLVDLHVAMQSEEREETGLLPSDKAALVSLLNVDLQMEQGQMAVMSAVDVVVESLCRSYGANDRTAALQLPRLLGLVSHQRDG